jgi:hypothetical protein
MNNTHIPLVNNNTQNKFTGGNNPYGNTGTTSFPNFNMQGFYTPKNTTGESQQKLKDNKGVQMTTNIGGNTDTRTNNNVSINTNTNKQTEEKEEIIINNNEDETIDDLAGYIYDIIEKKYPE